MDLKYALRPSRSEDEKFVNDLTRETMRNYVEATWPEEADREHYYEINRFQQAITQIIYTDSQPIGRLSTSFNEEGVMLNEIHLVPSAQGRGLGSEIIKTILEDAKAKARPVFLMVLKANPAKILYERLGFVIYKEENHRYYMRYDV